MTVGQFLASASSAEITEWMGYDQIVAWEQKQAAAKARSRGRR